MERNANTSNEFDQADQSLYEQALAASMRSESGVAMEILTVLLARNPNHAGARHLLAAELAQAGRINDALLEFSVALELNPAMPLARFQMGLLLMTCGRVEEAAQIWRGLDVLGSDHVLNRFRYCMMLVAQNELGRAQIELSAAIADNQAFPALNNEMQTVIQVIAAAGNSGETPAEENPDAKHFLVASYLQSPTIH